MTEEEINEIGKYHQNLLNDTLIQDELNKTKGITLNDILSEEIGYDNNTGEIIIPVKGEMGQWTEIKRFEVGTTANKEEIINNKEYKNVGLEDSLKGINYGCPLTFSGIIIGKDLAPFIVPSKIKVQCSEETEHKRCYYCQLSDKKEHEKVFTPDRDFELLAEFINVSSTVVMGCIRKHLKVPNYNLCRHVKIEVVERSNVEDIRITSEINYQKIDTQYVVHKCFSFAPNLNTNQQYSFYGTALVDPKNQQGIHMISKAKGATDSIQKWEMTNSIYANLTRFRVKDPHKPELIEDKIKEISRDLSANITHIKQRENVIEAFNMVYHSPLTFNLSGRLVPKGYSECLIVGDTRTGKTETVKTLVKHCKAGEYITSGENTTLAGILGGVQQTHSGRWTLTWGKLPMNDRRAVIIDEADNLVESGIMGHLSGVRSTGIAEIIKVQTQRTLARTRLIWLSNPVSGRVNEYSFGVEIVKELFKKQQDISRLDFAVVCGKEDVKSSVINSSVSDKVEHIYTSEACHDRVMWAWNINHDTIVFEDGVEETIYDYSDKMGRKYSADIPLVLSEEMRIKIARGAISIAIQTFNIGESRKNVIVTKAHVEYYVKWLSKLYDKTVIGYMDYSVQKRIDSNLKNLSKMDEYIDSVDTATQLLSATRLQLGDFEDIFVTSDRHGARDIISNMRRAGALKKKSFYYVKTPAFIKYLKARRVMLEEKDLPF